MSIPRRRAPPYEPPPGFKSASITLHPASEVTQLISPSALQGKELWHITLPSSVPISSITEVSTKSIFTGAAILSHDGVEYGLSPEIQDKTAKRIVLFPSSQSANYESAGITVTKTLHLQQMVRLPKSAARSDKLTDGASMKFTKNKNEQPPGLKMRYRPFGASSESSEKSDSEPVMKEPPSATHFQVPRNIMNPLSPKRKHDQTDYTDETQSPAKVRRKTKPASSDVLTELEQVLEQHISPDKASDVLPEAHKTAESKANPQHSTAKPDNESTNTPRPKSLKKTKTYHRDQSKENGKPITLSNIKTPNKLATSPRHKPIYVSSKQSPIEPLKSSPTKPSQNLPPSSQNTNSQNTKLSSNGETLSSKQSPIKLPKSSPSIPSLTLPPSPQTTISQNKKPPPNKESQQKQQQPPTRPHEIEIQQHAGKLDIQSAQLFNKYEHEVSTPSQIPNSTPKPTSKTKTKSKSTETPEEKARRKSELKQSETPKERTMRILELRERKRKKGRREQKQEQEQK